MTTFIESILLLLAINVSIYVTLTLTLNLEFGYAGLPNFGKVLFVAVGGALGGAASYFFSIRLFNIPTHGDPIAFNAAIHSATQKIIGTSIPLSMEILVFALLVASVLGGTFGFLVSYPAIKLREDYLGMFLLVSGEFFIVFMRFLYPIMGYPGQGILLPNVFQWGDILYGLRDELVVAAFGTLAVITYLYHERIARSPLGRTLRAMRDNEAAAAAVGKDIVGLRRRVLIIGSAISAMVGCLYALYLAHIDSDLFTRTEFTFWPWVMVILGGAGNNVGASVGTVIFVLILVSTTEAGALIQGGGTLQYSFPISYEGSVLLIVGALGAYWALHRRKRLAIGALAVGGAILAAGVFSPSLPATVGTLPVSILRVQPIIFGLILVCVLLFRAQGLLPEKSSATIGKSKIRRLIGPVITQGGPPGHRDSSESKVDKS